MIPDAFNFTVIFHHKFLSPPSPRQGRQGPIASDVDSLRLTIGPQASLLEQGMCLSQETDPFLGALNPFFGCAGAPIDGYISFFGEDEELTKIWGYTCAFRQTHVGGRRSWWVKMRGKEGCLGRPALEVERKNIGGWKKCPFVPYHLNTFLVFHVASGETSSAPQAGCTPAARRHLRCSGALLSANSTPRPYSGDRMGISWDITKCACIYVYSIYICMYVYL